MRPERPEFQGSSRNPADLDRHIEELRAWEDACARDEQLAKAESKSPLAGIFEESLSPDPTKFVEGPPGPGGPPGAAGSAGAPGNDWRVASGAPLLEAGDDEGDLYLDSDSGDVYVVVSGAWALSANILGPANLQAAYDGAPSGPQIITEDGDPLHIMRKAGLGLGAIFRIDNEDSQVTAAFRSHEMDLGNMSGMVLSGADTPPLRIKSDGTPNFMVLWPRSDTFTSSPGALFTALSSSTHIHDYANVQAIGIDLRHTVSHSQAGNSSNMATLLNHATEYRNTSGTSGDFGPIRAFRDIATVVSDGQALTISQFNSYDASGIFRTENGGSLTVTSLLGLVTGARATAGVTITSRTGLLVEEIAGAGATITAQVGIHVEDLGKAATNTAILLEQVDGLAISHIGTAASEFAGPIHLEDNIPLALGSIGSNTVELSHSAAGTMLAQGAGGTNNESLDLDFETSAGEVLIDSPSGARIRFDASIDIDKPIALGGGAAPTFGTIGGSGPTVTAQAEWVEVYVNGNKRFIAVWS